MQLSAPTTDFASLVSAVRGARKASPFPSREKFHLSRIPQTCPHERVPSERGDSARAKRRARRDFCGTFCSRRAHTHTHTHAVIAIGRLTNQRGERIAVPILHAVSPRVSRARASSFYRIGRPQGGQGGGEGGESLHRVNRAHTQWIRISRSSGGIVRRLFLFLLSPPFLSPFFTAAASQSRGRFALSSPSFRRHILRARLDMFVAAGNDSREREVVFAFIRSPLDGKTSRRAQVLSSPWCTRT